MMGPLVLAALLAGVGATGATGAQSRRGVDLIGEVTIEQRLNERLPLDAEFVDSTGQNVRLSDVIGDRPAILVFAYYECPMLCTMVLNGLAGCLGTLTLEMGSDYDVITISIDPGETYELAAAKKAGYVKRLNDSGASVGWHFLTGSEDAIGAATDAAGFRYAYDPDLDEYAHASGIMVVTPEGRLSHYFYGIEFPPSEVRLALVEAGQGRIGSLVDRVLLFCYHYDPATGRYGLAIMNVLRGAGALTLLGLVGAIVFFLKKEKREQVSPGAPLSGLGEAGES